MVEWKEIEKDHPTCSGNYWELADNAALKPINILPRLSSRVEGEQPYMEAQEELASGGQRLEGEWVKLMGLSGRGTGSG